jgi:hypothetical protein
VHRPCRGTLTRRSACDDNRFLHASRKRRVVVAFKHERRDAFEPRGNHRKTQLLSN